MLKPKPVEKKEEPVIVAVEKSLQEKLADAYEAYAMTPDHKRTFRMICETGIGGVVYTVVFPSP